MRARRLGLAWIFLLMPLRAQAQAVQGTVREEGPAGRAIGGAVVSLLDASGERVDADLSSPKGHFRVRAPRAGVYRVRVERIGYERWTSQRIPLGTAEVLTSTFRIPVRPVRLSDLRVEVRRECVTDPRRRADVSRVWEEARKALETTVWADSGAAYRFELTRYERELDPEFLSTRKRRSSSETGVRSVPFTSLPARELAAAGYVREEPDGASYYAPDARALLSEAFRDTHCFGVRRARRDGERLVGLTFEPRPGRTVADIRGSFWVSEETAELRYLEFRYVNAGFPSGTDRRKVGGRVDFQRVPEGPFFVSRWWIRVPLTARAPLPSTSRLGGRYVGPQVRHVLAGYRVEGGEVRRVTRAAQVVYGRPATRGDERARDSAGVLPPAGADSVSVAEEACAGAMQPAADGSGELRGVVRDSLSGVVLPRARVVAAWPASESGRPAGGAEASADDAGRFRLCGLPAEVAVTIEARFGGRASPRVAVSVPSGEVIHRDLGVSLSGDEFVRARPAGRAPSGRLMGRILDAGTSRPVQSAVVGLSGRGDRVMTDSAGRFMLDSVPSGLVEIEVRHVAYGERRGTVEVPAGQVVEAEIRLAPRPIPLEPIAVTVMAVRSLALETRGFYERKRWAEKLGFGHFITRRMIEERKPLRLSHLLADVPRVDLTPMCPGARCMVPRIVGSGPECRRTGASVYVDGHRFGLVTGGTVFGIDEIALPTEIAGVEVYTGSGGLPGEFADPQAQRCGAIVIWTGGR